ncbi:hypothetical protein SUNI508_00674 [Seiridium unicorne]|uniref:F-box domain-containing protein n=1 Tax=Seiridium unicorne TaxID=138068 RepID=A0ABR2V7Q8_9PEZI
MDTLSPEILHVVCSFLDIENVLRFRLVGKVFADIGAAYMLPEVSFYMFDGDFQRLRAIADHPIISKHVRSLTYFAEVMDNEKIPFSAFVRDNHRSGMDSIQSFLKGGPATEPLTALQLQKAYKDYEAVMKAQQEIIDNHTDVTCLKEVIPKFTSLRQATMSSGHEFYEGLREVHKVRGSPFEFSPLWPGSDLEPEGKRHLNGLIAALMGSDCHLESFRAGVVDWKFFKNFTRVPDSLAEKLKFLKRIEIHIDADPKENMSSIARCRKAMQEGILRKLLKPLQRLEALHVTLYPVEWADEEWPASLDDIIAPGHQWPHLEEVGIGGFITTRHDLIKFLELHKNTLKKLCLRDVGIGATSWWKLLPDIRNKLNLEDVCICGDIVGNSEDDSQVVPNEYWDLSTPDVCRDKVRESINTYCRGPDAYPDEVPLKREVAFKHFAQYVSQAGDGDSVASYGDEEDDDEFGDPYGWGEDYEDYLDNDDFFDDDDELDEWGDLDLLTTLLDGGPPFGNLGGLGEVDDFDEEWEEDDDDENEGGEAGDGDRPNDDDDETIPDLIDTNT